MKHRRFGFSLVEVLVAVAILSVSMAAFLTFTTQETRNTSRTEERFLATQLLAELREGLGARPLYFYQQAGFPENFSTFSSLHATLLRDHPLLRQPEASATDAFAETRRQCFERLEVRRAVLLKSFTTQGGRAAGVVTFVVRFRNRQGDERELTASEVVY